MISFKNKYFLIIESIKDIDLSNIKISNKFIIIYRNKKIIDDIDKLLQFRDIVKLKEYNFLLLIILN